MLFYLENLVENYKSKLLNKISINFSNLTVLRRVFFSGSFVLFKSVFVMLSHLFIAALWPSAGLVAHECDV